MYLILDTVPGSTTQEKKFDMKEETDSIKEESSTVEDTCTVYVQGESMKIESTELKSRTFIFYLILIFYYYVIIVC